MRTKVELGGFGDVLHKGEVVADFCEEWQGRLLRKGRWNGPAEVSLRRTKKEGYIHLEVQPHPESSEYVLVTGRDKDGCEQTTYFTWSILRRFGIKTRRWEGWVSLKKVRKGKKAGR